MKQKSKFIKILEGILLWIWSLTWGLPLSLIGLFGGLFFLIKGKKPYKYKHSFYFKVGSNGWGGLEGGPIFFVCPDTTTHTKYHEWGHGIQNLILGPFTIILITIPSAIRYWYRRNLYKKGKFPKTAYDAIWFEGWASSIGKKYYKPEDDSDTTK